MERLRDKADGVARSERNSPSGGDAWVQRTLELQLTAGVGRACGEHQDVGEPARCELGDILTYNGVAVPSVELADAVSKNLNPRHDVVVHRQRRSGLGDRPMDRLGELVGVSSRHAHVVGVASRPIFDRLGRAGRKDQGHLSWRHRSCAGNSLDDSAGNRREAARPEQGRQLVARRGSDCSFDKKAPLGEESAHLSNLPEDIVKPGVAGVDEASSDLGLGPREPPRPAHGQRTRIEPKPRATLHSRGEQSSVVADQFENLASLCESEQAIFHPPMLMAFAQCR